MIVNKETVAGSEVYVVSIMVEPHSVLLEDVQNTVIVDRCLPVI